MSPALLFHFDKTSIVLFAIREHDQLHQESFD